MNGLGERAGNASFAEVATALRVACQYDPGLDLRGLCALGGYVAAASQRGLPSNMPVVGEAVFSHASGIHLSGLNRDAAAYEAFSPELVGHAPSRHFFGIQSGPAALREFASQSGHTINPADLPEITRRLRKFCREHRTALSPAEAIHLVTTNP